MKDIYASVLAFAIGVIVFLAGILAGLSPVLVIILLALVIFSFFMFEKQINQWFASKSSWVRTKEPIVFLKGKTLKIFEEKIAHVMKYNLGQLEARNKHLIARNQQLVNDKQVTQKINITNTLTKAHLQELVKLEHDSLMYDPQLTAGTEFKVVSAKGSCPLGRHPIVFLTPEHRAFVKFITKRNELFYTEVHELSDLLPDNYKRSMTEAKILPIYYNEDLKFDPPIYIGVKVYEE